MFLKNQLEKADKEQDCFGYNLQLMIESYLTGDFGKAAIYTENAKRSLNELDSMKREKKMYEQAKEMLESLKQQDEGIRRYFF